MVKCPECTAMTELGPDHLPHAEDCSLHYSHGMNGMSKTHCCYKHEYKESVKDESTENLKSLFVGYLPGTFSNSFDDIDRCDAIHETLEERGIDIFGEHGLNEEQTRLHIESDWEES